jgi:hypothetical protein
MPEESENLKPAGKGSRAMRAAKATKPHKCATRQSWNSILELLRKNGGKIGARKLAEDGGRGEK